MTLDELTKNAFRIDQRKENAIDLAFFSLKVAIKSYFETYKVLKGSTDKFYKNDTSADEISFHGFKYCLLCQETLIHFQHFFELSIKRLLKKDHPLLSDVTLNNPQVLHKLLHSVPLSDDEERGLKSVEFSEALKRICLLIQKDQLFNSSELQFIKENKFVLEKINDLRNRIWHSGLFILKYTALDEFVGKYVMPLVFEIVNLEDFKDFKGIWSNKDLECGIDPINLIIEECKKESIDFSKIALLKELGRAAYENPLDIDKTESGLGKVLSDFFNKDHITRANRIAETESKCEHASIRNCPVCGQKTLIVFDDNDYEEDEEGRLIRSSIYSYRVKCECCSFEVEPDIKNPSEYGINSIKDFWYEKEL